MSHLTCVTAIFKAEGSFWRGAASQPKHGQVCDSDESHTCTCRESGVKISHKISCLKHLNVAGRGISGLLVVQQLLEDVSATV